MKRNITPILLAALCLLTALSLSAQQPPVVNGVMQGSPTTFMVDPATCNQANGWARAYNATYPSQSQATATTEGPNYTLGVASGWSSHQLMTNPSNTSSQTDNQACGVGGPSGHLPIFPLNWYSDTFPGSGLHYETQVMRVGNTSGNAKSAKMEYSFIPDTIKPVLLVAYECVLQAPNHHRVQNPSVLIQVSENNSNHNALFSLGNYPSDYITNGNNTLNNNPNCPRNMNWPYARYFYQAEGDDGPSVRPAEMTPSAFYTGSNFPTYECGSGYNKIVSTQYVTVAFNLMEQARNHTPVKFKIVMRGCTQAGHYAYLYFTAKMREGKINVDACPQDDTVTLSVPWGFDAFSYRWKHGLNKDTCAIFTPLNPYRVKIPRNELMPYYRCEMESQTGVPFVYEAHTSKYDFQPYFSYVDSAGGCKHNLVFRDSSINRIITPEFSAYGIFVPADTVDDPSPVLDWFWIRAPGDTVRMGSANDTLVRDTFPAYLNNVRLDSIKVLLRVNTSQTQACHCLDTVIWVKLDTANVTCPVTSDTIRICESSMVNGEYRMKISDSTYIWQYDHQVIPIVYKDSAWNGCDSIVKRMLMISQPKVSISSRRDYCEDFETVLETDKGSDTNYVWTWSDGSQDSLLNVVRAGTYSVTVMNKRDSCLASGTIVIPTCKPFMNLANAITPSDNWKAKDPQNQYNASNDCFTIPQWKLIQYVEFAVFTRTGELIYSYRGDPQYLRWCGTRGNTDKPVEYGQVYPYILKYKDLDGVFKVIKSTITVL